MLVVGPRDAEAGTVSVRDRLEGDLGPMPFDQANDKLRQEIAERTVRQKFDNDGPGLGDRGSDNEY